MFIQTEATPNPATLKFIPGREVMRSGTLDFRDPESAAVSPLASAIFTVDGVNGVFFGPDFITVSKENVEWSHVKPAILGAIMNHFTSGQPLMTDGSDSGSDHAEHEGPEAHVVAKIKELLDTRVRPAVAQDGGDITFHGFDKGIVYLTMRGACAGCPSSTMTLKAGIQNLLCHYLPEVTEVRPVE